MQNPPETLVQELRRRYESAKQIRGRLLPKWQKVSRYILPNSGRYWNEDRDRARNFGEILDNTASWAHGVLVAGIAAGAFPQAMPWVGLRLRDPVLAEDGIGASWTDSAAEIVAATFASANVYPALRHAVSEMAAFGPACLIVEEDPEKVLRIHRVTAGQFCLERDWGGNVVAVYREIQSTVGEVVEEFGYQNCREVVKQAWDQKRYSDEVEVLHVIDKRKKRDPTKLDNRNMPWRSVYIDKAATDDEQPLRESGYPFMPALTPRWDVNGDDTYGTSPALRALGDVSGLQHKHVRMGEAIDKMTRPATQGPPEIEEVYSMPGQHTKTTGAARIEPLAPPTLPIQHLWQQIVEGDHVRIRQAFYVDIFQAFLGDSRSNITAREILARHQEKIQGVGPVLNNIDHELLRPLVESTLYFLAKQGKLPPASPDIQGQELEVELEAPLFRAMKAEQSRGTMQLLEMLAQLGTVPGWDHVRDRADVDAAADELRDTFGAPARVLKTVREVQPVREARANALAAQQQMQAAQSMAGTAKDLAGAEVAPSNALGQLTGAQQ